MDSKRNVFLWVLYDFANSIVAIVFFLYFSQWLVIDQGVKDIYFNLTFTISAILLLFTAPLCGSLLDKYHRRITGLRYATFLTFVFYGACALFAVYGKAIPALIFFILGIYVYLLSFTFYTPLLNDISKSERRGFISGLGITANYLGQFAGLILVLPFASGSINLFGGDTRAETLLPAVFVFFILALPMLIFFKEPRKYGDKLSLGQKIKNVFIETRALLSVSSVAFFLLAYFLFNDAVLTAANNFPIFLEQVWGVPDTTKTYILLGVLVTSAVGGLASGLVADRVGHKKTLMYILTGWIFLLPLIGLLTNFTLFIISTTLMGFWFGATWTVSRSVMSYVAPSGNRNLAFSYFGIAERASSLLGPVVWGLVVSGLVSLGAVRYRIAALVVTVFVIFGVLALRKVKSDDVNVTQS
ncbi:MAG: MFS transporter [Nanoarchaeota archaeon]